MRIRTLATFVTGAALGAGSIYLLDPETGEARRKDAVRSAWQRSKDVDWAVVATRASRAATQVARRAVDGYRDGAGA
ncbi:MAG: gas vesicle protein [Myxococcota bacterium]|jgi:gas vesicle protein